ncbi:MAG TPA: hypothetical protein VKP58_09145 [Candidatus Acidoferrum sp.]|nr:hypothetical protein [Candidatus Acidoferrum sp.]
MRPSEALEDAIARSFAAAACGFLVGGSLRAAGVFDQDVLVLCTIQAAFFGSLALLLGYYHRRWVLGSVGAALVILVPYVVNLLWIRFSTLSLLYPVAAQVLLIGTILGIAHKKISGPQPEDEIEEQMIRTMMEEWELSVTWKDRIMWVCIAASLLIMLVLILR